MSRLRPLHRYRQTLHLDGVCEFCHVDYAEDTMVFR